jgi:hypothetical protein
MVLFDEDESDWDEVADFINDAICLQIFIVARVEGIATIDCFGVTKALHKRLCQALERFKQQGHHRFDTLKIERNQSYVWIYPSQTGASTPQGLAQFFLTDCGIVRWPPR